MKVRIEMVIKEECGICGRVLPYYKLRKCARCGRLYCQDCMIEDVTLPYPLHQRMVCLKCARKAVTPKNPANKYAPLTNYLVNLAKYTNYASLTFSKIEGLIGDSLPESAYKKVEWWKNTDNTIQGHAWMLARWQVKEVKLEERRVIFTRETPLKERRKRRERQIKKPFTPVPVRKVKPRRPSKTKISKIIARTQNIQKFKSTKRIRGKFKPKPAHEKRLFKPEAKPKEG